MFSVSETSLRTSPTLMSILGNFVAVMCLCKYLMSFLSAYITIGRSSISLIVLSLRWSESVEWF